MIAARRDDKMRHDERRTTKWDLSSFLAFLKVTFYRTEREREGDSERDSRIPRCIVEIASIVNANVIRKGLINGRWIV